MIHIGMLHQLQLPMLLQLTEQHKKTGRIIVVQGNSREEIYVFQGQVVAVVSENTQEPLIRRLLRSSLISLDDLQKIPDDIGRIINQLQGSNQCNDTKIAKILIKLDLIRQEALVDWIQQETEIALQHLLACSPGNVSFEEGMQPPASNLSVLLIESWAAFIQSEEKRQSATDVIMSSEVFAPPTPRPRMLKDLQSEYDEQALTELSRVIPIIPITPSGFAQLPKKAILTTQTAVQRAVAAVLPLPFPNYVATARVAAPPRPNPLFRWETLLIVAVLLIAGLAHGINMFHYPYYEDDEGTYLSQAWAIIHLGRLGYYTYWYDHAPLGWVQIALWAIITGGFHTFGIAMNSGRILMLLFQLGSTFILYRISRIISASTTIAVVTALLFALSPYGLYFHRRILLDNIMTFWMLLSILPLISQHLSLKNVWFSAIALAVSILSKEVTVFIVPILAYLVWIRIDKLHRLIALVGWLTLVLAILSGYPLLAMVKGELFPTGTFLGGSNPHVSLINSVLYQGSRVHDGGIFNPNSLTRLKINSWVQDDFILTVIGSGCSVISVLFIFIRTKKHKLVGIMGAVTLSIWAFILRGGVVLDFYFIPLIPLLALNIGLVIGLVIKYGANLLHKVSGINPMVFSVVERCLIISCLIYGFVTYLNPGTGIGFGSSNLGDKNNTLVYWTSKQADTHTEAVDWVINHHIPKTSYIVIDQSMWPDLYHNGYIFSHYYWKVILDPAIGGKIFHNNWKSINYIITTPQMMDDIRIANMVILKIALQHSVPIASFKVDKYVVEIRKVNK